MWGSSKVRKQHKESGEEREGPNGFENTHRAGKYFPTSTSYLSPLFPDTLTLRYILFLPPSVRVCVYVFWEHSPESSTDRCISSSLPSSVTKKKLKGLNFRFFAALDMPFSTHHFNGLTESLYTALHRINMWTHTHTTWTVTNPRE